MTMTNLLRPARATSGNPLAHLSRSLDARIAEIRGRRGMRKMLTLDDQQLDDLGITRADIQSVTNAPLSVDAATELHRLSLIANRLHV